MTVTNLIVIVTNLTGRSSPPRPWLTTNDSGEVFYLAAYAHYGQIQHKRFRGLKLYANAQMGIKEIKKFCPVCPHRIFDLENEKARVRTRADFFCKVIP